MKRYLIGALALSLFGCGDVKKYPDFSFPNEINRLRLAAYGEGIETEYLLAIREAERGREGREMGIMPSKRYLEDTGLMNGKIPYISPLEKQAVWAAKTVGKNLHRYNNLPAGERSQYRDFIDFLGDRYAPRGAENDPSGLNASWEKNVRFFYMKFKS